MECNSIWEGNDSGMKLKDKRSETSGLHADTTVQSLTDDISANRAANCDEIRRRAYEIYLERGGLPGEELEDWLQAEREIESAAHFMRAKIGEKHRS